MKKLTGEQILEIVEQNYSVDSFAHCYWHDTLKPVKIDNEAALIAGEVRTAFYEQHKEHLHALSVTEKQHDALYIEYTKMKSSWKIEQNLILTKLGLGEIEEVDQHGGEGEGSRWWSVKHFVYHDVYIRTNGYYQSYNGTDFHDGYGQVVVPQQKQITIYE